jgi:hypothetical protein
MGMALSSFLVIINQIDVRGVSVVVESEDNPPVPGNGDSIEPGTLTLESVQSQTGQVHVLGALGDIQPGKDHLQPLDLFLHEALGLTSLVKGA